MNTRHKALALAAVGMACIPTMAAARSQIRAVGSSTVYPFATAVAERLAALQVSPHGTLAAICESPLEPFPVGWLSGPAAVKAILARIDHVSRTNLIRIKEIHGIDPVAETILVDLAGELDKAAWMLRVQEE